MTGTDLIPVDYAQQRTQALAHLGGIDEKDEEQIIALLAGDLVEEYVYDLRGKLGLSGAGYREWASWRGNLKMPVDRVEDLAGAWETIQANAREDGD